MMTRSIERRSMDVSFAKHRHLTRVGAVVAAILSGTIAWVAISPFGGTELVVPIGGVLRPVAAGDVILAAVVSGLGAVVSAVLVGRWARRPRRTWTVLATGVFLVSLVGPLTSGAATPVVWSLIALHSVVAVVLIPQVGRTLRRETEHAPAVPA